MTTTTDPQTCLVCCGPLNHNAPPSICCTQERHCLCDNKECWRGLLDQAAPRDWNMPCSQLGLPCTGLFSPRVLKDRAKELNISVSVSEDVTPPPATFKQLFEDVLTNGAVVKCPHCGIFTQKDGACMHMHCSYCTHSFCFCCGRESGRGEGLCPRGEGGCDAINCYLEKNPSYSPPSTYRQLSPGDIALEQFYIRRTMWFLKLFCFTLESALEILQFIILLEKNEIQDNIYSLAQILETAPPLYGETTESDIVIPTMLEKSHTYVHDGHAYTATVSCLRMGLCCADNSATIIQKHLRGAFARNRYDYLQHHSSDWNPVCSTYNCETLCSIVPKTLEFYDTCCRTCCDDSMFRPICATLECNRPRAPIRRSADFHPKCSLTCCPLQPGGEFNYRGYRHWLKVSQA